MTDFFYLCVPPKPHGLEWSRISTHFNFFHLFYIFVLFASQTKSGSRPKTQQESLSFYYDKHLAKIDHHKRRARNYIPHFLIERKTMISGWRHCC